MWSTRDELWGADREFVTKCEGVAADPADWTLPVPCGDGIALVSGMADVASRMYFFTDDGGVWSLQADTTAVPLFRGLETTRDPRNGRNPTPWLNQLYFRSGDSFYRLSGTETAAFDPVGPERLQTNTSPVRGPVGAFAGVLGYYAFAGVYNPRCSAPDGYGQHIRFGQLRRCAPRTLLEHHVQRVVRGGPRKRCRGLEQSGYQQGLQTQRVGQVAVLHAPTHRPRGQVALASGIRSLPASEARKTPPLLFRSRKRGPVQPKQASGSSGRMT